MTIDAPDPMRGIAVGQTREAAARAFGRGSDELFLTTHHDLPSEVDLDRAASLDVVGDEGFDRTLAAVAVHAGRVAVRLAVRPGSTADLATALADQQLAVVAVVPGEEFALLTLAQAPPSTSSSLLLQALDAGAASSTRRDAPAPDRTPAGARDPRRIPPLVRLLDSGRNRIQLRGALVLVAALGLVGVALLVAALAGDLGSRLAGAVVPLLVIGVLATTMANAALLLLLAQQVHRQTGRIEKAVTGQRTAVQRPLKELSQRLARVETHTEQVPFLAQHTEAVAQHSAASSARMREVLQRIDPEDPSQVSR